jgi:hypothetical protein
MNKKNELVLEAKGRNGIFRVDSTSVMTLQKNSHLMISINSYRVGSASPLYIEGTVEDVATYFDAIRQTIQETQERIRNHSSFPIINYINKKGEIKS